jgi:hypothetical protein
LDDRFLAASPRAFENWPEPTPPPVFKTAKYVSHEQLFSEKLAAQRWPLLKPTRANLASFQKVSAVE